MKRINRLLLEAKAALGELLRPLLALIERKGTSWATEIQFQNGPTERSGYSTLDEAVDSLAQRFPGEDFAVIVDDL